MEKPAPTDHDVHELIRNRWSPRAFSQKAVTEEAIRSLFEAARWAPSSFNEQPWRFLVARAQDPQKYERMLSCLVEKNQQWAKLAPVLAISVARTLFARNDKPNRHALYDVGQATAQLALQAMALGLYVHQMAGFSSERTRELYAIPDDCEPVAALAIGYPGDLSVLPKDFLESERRERSRRGQDEIVFDDAWKNPL